jgi:Fanconi anaemia protein FancD2 nuclease
MQLKTYLKGEIKAGHLSSVADAVKQLQTGTRVLQTACAEAKARKIAAVTRLIPKIKRSIEVFVHSMKVLMAESRSGCDMTVGNLKHKNLQGEVVPDIIESDAESAEGDDEEEAAEQERDHGSEGGEQGGDAMEEGD